MKKNLLFFFVCVVVSAHFVAHAQEGIVNVEVATSKDGVLENGSVSYSRSSITFFGDTWRPPAGLSIISVGEKFVKDKSGTLQRTRFYVLLSDGTVYSIDGSPTFLALFSGVVAEYRSKIENISSGGLRDFIGDDLYTISLTTVYVSRDGGNTWAVDTLGLGGAAPRKLAMDSLQNVYLATNKGLFKQGLTESVWHPITSMTKDLRSAFVDDKNRWLYVGTTAEGIYKSSNFGTTWQIDTTGSGTLFVFQFEDDRAGNIYARSNNSLYRSTGGTQPWTRVDAGLRSKSATGSIAINGVTADSILAVATNFGVFRSTDFGATWTEANESIQAENVYGYLKLPSGRLIATTDLGAFTRNAGTTGWTKTFPTNGYQRFSFLQRDRNGALYTANSVNIYKSVDGGTTWTQDNPGWQGSGPNGLTVPVQPGGLYVDENGSQHYWPGPLAVYTTFLKFIYVKSGGNWVVDESGITTSVGDQYYGYASDQQGNLFLFRTSASNAQVYRRPIGGGTWSPDTAGLRGKALISMVRDRNGTMIGGAFGGGIFRRVNGVWTSIPVPAAVATSHVQQLSVDSTGALFASFTDFDPAYSFDTRGVYFTKDNGATWTFAGLKDIGVRQLVSYGDSTFALTDGYGVALLRSIAFAFLQPSSRGLFFDNVVVGQSKNLSLTITNTGTDSLRITNITSTNGVFVPQQTTATIGPQQSLAITIRFTPSSIATFTGALPITSNSSSSPDTIRLAGIGASATAVEKLEGIPAEFSLSQNFPNPFNPTTTIRYGIPEKSTVKLEIFNVLGQRIATLVNEQQQPAFYTVTWDASSLSTGIYFYRLQAGGFVQTKKLLLMK